jgi:hypothetical protein
LRASLLLEADASARERLHGDLVALAERRDPSAPAVDAVRRALVQVLRDGNRPELIRQLDRTLLGVGDASRVRLAS